MGSVKGILFALAGITSVWSLGIFLSDGFNVRLLGIRVSSQNPYRAAMVSLACAAIASTLHTAGPTGTGRWHRSWLRPDWIVTAFGIGLLIWQWSAARPLWLDEQMIALNLRDRTVWDLSHQLSFDQSAPFGWLLLERIALLGLGANELALRLAPALFGIATLVCALTIGRRWMSPVGSTAFALLCSFGQWLSFYAVELKHYSADAFGGLLLPALTVWVTEADADDIRTRLAVWAAVIAVAHWFSIGGLLVTPVCAAVLTVVLMRSRLRPGVLYLCGLAAICAVSFGVHYAVSLRYARESEYLRNFWQFAFPPASGGAVATLQWLRDQLDDFALKPGGTELAVLFWASAAAGFGLTRRRLLGSVAAAVVFSGFLFAVLRLVPLYERLSLWFVPALYLGVALFADSAASFMRQSRGRWGWISAGIAAVVTFQVCSDVFRHGVDDVRNFRPVGSNRSTDDRTAILWLMNHRQPGDPVVTTRMGLPAVLWYGDGGPILLAEHSSSESECGTTQLGDRLKGRPRVLAYLGFRDFPAWFDDQLLQALTDEGFSILAMRHFGSLSRAAVVALDAPARPMSDPPRWEDAVDEPLSQSYGCVTGREASRW